MTPLADFSNSIVFTPTSAASVAKLKQTNNQFFVKKVKNLEQAIACGAVLFLSGNDWVVLSADAVRHLASVNELPVRLALAPKFGSDSRGLGLPYQTLRVDPSYSIEPITGQACSYAGVVTRATSIVGWSKMTDNPFIRGPHFLNLHTVQNATSAADVNGVGELATNPNAGSTVMVEVVAFTHPFGVVDLFNRQETQSVLDAWGDGLEFKPQASAFIRSQPNKSYPSPLLHVWTPTSHHFGPGEAEEVRSLRTIRVGDASPPAPSDYPALPSRLSWHAENTLRVPFSLLSPNAQRGEYNTNANVAVVSNLGDAIDAIMLSRCQWGSPSGCYKAVAADGVALGLLGLEAASVSGGTVMSVAQEASAGVGRSVGTQYPFVLPWVGFCEALYSVQSLSYNMMGVPPLNAYVTQAGVSPYSVTLLGLQDVMNRGAPPLPVGTGVPQFISDRPALHVLGGSFVGCYYGTDLKALPVTGVSIATSELIQIAPKPISVDFELVYPDTTGMTAEQKRATEEAAEFAFKAWPRPAVTSIQGERASERWLYSMIDGFADLMTSYYTEVERLAKLKYE